MPVMEIGRCRITWNAGLFCSSDFKRWDWRPPLSDSKVEGGRETAAETGLSLKCYWCRETQSSSFMSTDGTAEPQVNNTQSDVLVWPNENAHLELSSTDAMIYYSWLVLHKLQPATVLELSRKREKHLKCKEDGPLLSAELPLTVWCE